MKYLVVDHWPLDGFVAGPPPRSGVWVTATPTQAHTAAYVALRTWTVIPGGPAFHGPASKPHGDKETSGDYAGDTLDVAYLPNPLPTGEEWG